MSRTSAAKAGAGANVHLLVLVLVLSLAGACGRAQQAAPPPAAHDAPLVHVHGLGVDVADGTLYVATHTGLFRVEDGAATRVGEATHDLMGFTVAGPGDLLASGHPDLRATHLQVAGKPPLLGLVHSEDGKEWTPLSLLGEADFHALEARHGRVYGWFDGSFMVTADRRHWETRSQVALFDFAVDPQQPDTLVASGEGGIISSSDGGRTWTAGSDEPYVLLSWVAGGLYGVAPDGQVGESEDGGVTWQPLGSVGARPQAFLATGESLYAATEERGVLVSGDGGRTWDVLVEP